MARQLCCRGMCKNLLRSDGQQRNYSKAKFPSNLNCGQKIVSETGPRTIYQLSAAWELVMEQSRGLIAGYGAVQYRLTDGNMY